MDPVTWTMPVSVTHAAYERADGFVITNTATVTGIGFERDLSDNTTEVTTTAGGPAFTLTVTGTGFVAGSVVQWDGAARTTAFVSTTQLTALPIETRDSLEKQPFRVLHCSKKCLAPEPAPTLTDGRASW